mgnify:CR=1 FL=1
MEQYLPLKDMNRGEIAAFGSLVYNCGPGVLRGRNKMPTELSAAFARYKKDGREEDKNIVKKLINAKIYAKGRALPSCVTDATLKPGFYSATSFSTRLRQTA